ncbi:MAG: hypothetical protein M1837_003050 [Sclerophora amabilis]|nr:MAG: hypothetical protein M1837_003050 [Sclerophora amabilis]
MVSDTSRLVADSVAVGKPIITVSLNYRVGILGFGDCKGGVNYGLHDQTLGIEWVQQHIAGFGGDKDNVTLAGESAGALSVHAHTIMKVPARRAILQSGSLFASPPQPVSRGKEIVAELSRRVEAQEQLTLREASISTMMRQVSESGIRSSWFQLEPALENWMEQDEDVEQLLIGDVEYESVIWRNGVESLDPDTIIKCFERCAQGQDLCRLYGISSTRPTASKLGALDFINDVKFAWGAEQIASRWRSAGKPVYQYIVDETNPWQASSRAHHAVDLLFLFGGYDGFTRPKAEEVGQDMRRRWIAFVNGSSPWSSEKRFAFGPHGQCGEFSDEDFASRRRTRHWELLKEIGFAEVNAVAGALVAGRSSLEN